MLLTATAGKIALDRELSAALRPWMRPSAVHEASFHELTAGARIVVSSATATSSGGASVNTPRLAAPQAVQAISVLPVIGTARGLSQRVTGHRRARHSS